MSDGQFATNVPVFGHSSITPAVAKDPSRFAHLADGTLKQHIQPLQRQAGGFGDTEDSIEEGHQAESDEEDEGTPVVTR